MDLEGLFNSDWFDASLTSAIFDGPLRIYFHPSHESLALELYGGIRSVLQNWKGSWERHFIVFLYPHRGEMDPRVIPFAWGLFLPLPVASLQKDWERNEESLRRLLEQWVVFENLNGEMDQAHYA